MRSIMFKFNNDRQEQYSIQTIICKDINGKYVLKKGLTSEAKRHVEKMHENQKILQKIYPQYKFSEATIEKDGVRFEYLDGHCYSDLYEMALKKKDKDNFLYLLEHQKDIILSCTEENKDIFVESEEYRKIFGNGNIFRNLKALKNSNFEFTSHNTLLNEKNEVSGVIDYEYVFCFPIPIDLLIYHCVVKTNILTIADFTSIVSIQEMLDFLKVDTSVESLEKAWNQFNDYYGKKSIVDAKNRYLKGSEDIVSLNKKLQETEYEILGNENYINILTENLGKQQKYIESLNENIKEQQKCIENQIADIEGKNKSLAGMQQELQREKIRLYQKNAECLHLNAVTKLLEDKKEWENEILRNKLEEQVKMYEDTQEKMQNQINIYQNEIQNLKNSFCWKITTPIRKGIDWGKETISN